MFKKQWNTLNIVILKIAYIYEIYEDLLLKLGAPHVAKPCHVCWFIVVCSSDDTVEDISNIESLQYDFSTVQLATNYFSDSNKLGEGGFGSVHKVRP